MKNTGNKYHKVCILGASLLTGNRGVSALSCSLIKLFLKQLQYVNFTHIVSHYEPVKIKITCFHQNLVINVLNYRLTARSRLRQNLFWMLFLSCMYKIIPLKVVRTRILAKSPVLSAIYNSDFIGDIKGGDSFSDIYGLKIFFTQALMDIIIINLKKKLILFPQTYGPYKSKISRIIASYILKKSGYIISRDSESIDLVKGLIKNRKKTILFCPDVAFTLDAIEPARISLYPHLDLESSTSYIGINISGLLYQGGYTKNNMFGFVFDYHIFVYHLLIELLKQTRATILLIPHTYSKALNQKLVEDDRNACLDLQKRLNPEEGGRVHVLSSSHTPEEIKWVIHFCEFFIGSRMHSCIAALSQGIPAIGIAYSKKFKGIFKTVNMEDMVINARTTDETEVIRKILLYYNRREECREHLKHGVARAKQVITSVFTTIIEQNIDK